MTKWTSISLKEYIKEHPLLKDEVLTHKRTWQEIYEAYTLSSDDPFPDYKKKEIRLDLEKEIKTRGKKRRKSQKQTHLKI